MARLSGRAAQPLLLCAGAIADFAGGLGVVAVEALIGAAGVVFLAGIGQRHPELQQEIRRLRAPRKFLIAVSEGCGGIRVVLADIERLAEPVLRRRSQGIPGIMLNEAAERLLGVLVTRLSQQAEGGVVLVLGRARGTGLRLPRRRRRRLRGAPQDRIRARGTSELLTFGDADHAEHVRLSSELLGVAACA